MAREESTDVSRKVDRISAELTEAAELMQQFFIDTTNAVDQNKEKLSLLLTKSTELQTMVFDCHESLSSLSVSAKEYVDKMEDLSCYRRTIDTKCITEELEKNGNSRPLEEFLESLDHYIDKAKSELLIFEQSCDKALDDNTRATEEYTKKANEAKSKSNYVRMIGGTIACTALGIFSAVAGTSTLGGSSVVAGTSTQGGSSVVARTSTQGGSSAVAGTSTQGGSSVVAGTSKQGGSSAVAGTSKQGGSSVVAGTSKQGGSSVVAGTSKQGGSSVVARTSTQGGSSAVAGTSTQGGSSVVAGTSKQGGSSVVAGTSKQGGSSVVPRTSKEDGSSVVTGISAAAAGASIVGEGARIDLEEAIKLFTQQASTIKNLRNKAFEMQDKILKIALKLKPMLLEIKQNNTKF